MAEDRYSSWVHEYGGTSRLPSISATLLLFTIITVVLLALLYQPTAGAESGRGISPACAEQQRLAGHGVVSGPSYRRAAAACEASR
jgi:hypothetical protein